MFKIIAKIGALIFCSAVVLSAIYFSSKKDAENNLINEVVIEAGSSIKIEDFFNDCPDDARFITDVSGIDTSVPAVYGLKVFYDRSNEEDVVLRIEDRTAPQGEAVPQFLYTTWKYPDAESCVDKLYDLSGIAEIKYQNGTPSFKKTGDYEVPVCVTDMYGNSAVINVPFKVINDRNAPVIKGVHDFEVGDDPHELDFFKGITVTDDYDKKPVLKVDDSRVNYSKSGEYVIIYCASDEAGNIGTSKVKIKVTIPGDDEENTVEEEDLDALYYYYTNHADESYGLASNILDGLRGSNDVETALAIFEWVHSNVSYMTINYYQSYEAAAFRGFSTRNGDCYVYFCCCKMLLDLAGIPNMMVTRYPVTGNGHYWNLVKLNGEWYHCDATRFMYHPEIFFMCTDAEIDDSHHQYDGYQYPKRAGGSEHYSTSPVPTPSAAPSTEETTVPVPTDTSVPADTDEPVNTDETATDIIDKPDLTEPDDEPVIQEPEETSPALTDEPGLVPEDDKPVRDDGPVKPASDSREKHEMGAELE